MELDRSQIPLLSPPHPEPCWLPRLCPWPGLWHNVTEKCCCQTSPVSPGSESGLNPVLLSRAGGLLVLQQGKSAQLSYAYPETRAFLEPSSAREQVQCC